jgi:hypothetical protein
LKIKIFIVILDLMHRNHSCDKNTIFNNDYRWFNHHATIGKTALLTEKNIRKKRGGTDRCREIMYSKNDILEMYLNHIPYGGTAYGIEAAAQTYLNKHAKDLNLAEASFLATIQSLEILSVWY